MVSPCRKTAKNAITRVQKQLRKPAITPAGKMPVARLAQGSTAVASISTLARSSISATTCTMAMAGKWRPSVRR